MFIGEFDRESGFCREIMIFLDFSGIPAGSTINSVECKFTIVTNTLGGAMTPHVNDNDKGAPLDDSANSPTYLNRTGVTNWSAGAWPAFVSSFTALNGASTGIITAATTAGIEALIQDKLDTPSNNNGILFTGASSFAGWYVEVNTIEVNVDYTAPVAQSKMMIL